jgi:hypothetical protein
MLDLKLLWLFFPSKFLSKIWLKNIKIINFGKNC